MICLQICIFYQSAPSAKKNCTICSPHETFAFCRQLSFPTNFIHTHPASCIPTVFAGTFFHFPGHSFRSKSKRLKHSWRFSRQHSWTYKIRFSGLSTYKMQLHILLLLAEYLQFFSSMACQGNDEGWGNSSKWWTTSPPKQYGCFTCACVCKLWVWEGNLWSCHFYSSFWIL